MECRTNTPLLGAQLVGPDGHGQDRLTCVAKATMALGAKAECLLAEEQRPLRLEADWFGEPGISTCLAPIDVGPRRPGTDILLRGQVLPATPTATAQLVSVEVGNCSLRLACFGRRVWEKRLGLLRMGAPEPLQPLPLIWEHAYGGCDPTNPDFFDERNPVGRGFAQRSAALAGTELPAIEDPDELIATAGQRPSPAGCCAVVPAHPRRRALAGTYDEAWQRQRAPYLPDDFNPHFHHCAVPSLQSVQPLVGGGAVTVSGCHPDGAQLAVVPSWALEAELVHTTGAERAPLVIDQVLIDTDAEVMEILWKAEFPVHGRVHRLLHWRLHLQGNAP